ncbi:MAG TPA: phosphorylase, partial [Sphingobacteriaceae bacterium]
IRIGTSGAIQPEIEVGSIVISEYALGLDALMQYYLHDLDGNERDLQDAANSYFHHLKGLNPYVTSADKVLLQRFEKDLVKGITVTSPGFYAPQGREIRIRTTIPDFIELLSNFRMNDLRLTNLEMETAGIYALAKSLGHNAVSINAILGNRITHEFTESPEYVTTTAIEKILFNL